MYVLYAYKFIVCVLQFYACQGVQNPHQNYLDFLLHLFTVPFILYTNIAMGGFSECSQNKLLLHRLAPEFEFRKI